MKTRIIVPFLLLGCMAVSFGLSPVAALTPSGGWGASVDEELYYTVTGSAVGPKTYWKYKVQEVSTGGNSIETK